MHQPTQPKSKTLVIHPADASTTFLDPIWKDKGYDVRQGGEFTDDLIAAYDRVIMLGHGYMNGLFSVGRFTPMNGYCDPVISRASAPRLQGKDNIYIWCFASTFVEQHDLKGFATGMFISEVGEAATFDIRTTQEQIDHSNALFARIVLEHESRGSAALHAALMREYTHATCPVIRYNRDLMRHYPTQE